jgi:hypothetical protein
MSMLAIPFDCQIYVPRRGNMAYSFPAESGPQHVARLEPLRYDELIDPAFRRLLAAFETVQQRPAVARV